MFSRILIGATFLLICTTLRAQTAPASAPASESRKTVLLTDAWRFHKGAEDAAEAPDHSDASWEAVTVPHTWNAKDGADGGSNYYRGDGWYRRHINVDASMAGKELFLRFEAANRKADVFVNGTLLGSHAGGMSAFCFDATKLLHSGDNVLAVKVNNSDTRDIPPISADFTFWGGLYRPVELIAVNALHFSLTDYASSGVYVSTPEVTSETVLVHIKALYENAGARQMTTATAQVFDREGNKVAQAGRPTVTAEAASGGAILMDLSFAKPHLWNGRLDPYMYSLRVSLTPNATNAATPETDAVTIPFGIRTFSVDPEKGFILNGKPYDLHGVNRHQDREGKGWAISDADNIEDMALIKEMGCTGIRLSHYQQADLMYTLADQAGIVVWAEIPVVNTLGSSEAFTKNAQQQYTELIRQNFNHPSICFWSAGNEVDPPRAGGGRRGGTASAPAAPDVFPWFKSMGELAHKEDPSRLSTVAWREAFSPPANTTDVFGLNPYMGWYSGGQTNGWNSLEQYITRNETGANAGNKGKFAFSEYGAGSSIYFHSENPVRMDHSEEYQCEFHEYYWSVLKKHPEIWGKFLWCMFDFGVDSRAEGDHAGINDKGMVTYDRKTKKDVFYFYKANWSDEPTLYIASKRFAVRGKETIPVKVYSNAAKVTLAVNGQSLGEKPADNGTVVWDAVKLKEGANEVIATSRAADGKELRDTCTWTYTPGAPLEVDVAQDDRMRQALKAGPPRAR